MCYRYHYSREPSVVRFDIVHKQWSKRKSSNLILSHGSHEHIMSSTGVVGIALLLLSGSLPCPGRSFLIPCGRA